MTTPWILTEREDGLTALEALRRHVPAAPASYLRQLLRRGKVRRGEHPLEEDSLLRAGDRIVLPASGRLAELLALPPAGVEILLETPDLLVACKPAGLATHRGVGHEEDNLLDRVRKRMKERGAPFAVAPIHRLDAETSGPVLFGKGRRAAGLLGKLFMGDEVTKSYLALASGELSGSGELTSPVSAKGKTKPARTAFTVLSAHGGFSLLELRLQSGRTHQIRRQLAAAGHPLAGDRRYGGPGPADLGRLFLHCRLLSFPDLLSRQPLRIEVPLPDELKTVLVALGMDERMDLTGGKD